MKLLSPFQLANFYIEIEREVTIEQKSNRFSSNFSVQKGNIPSMSIPSSSEANKLMRYTSVTNSSAISYSALTLSFLLDEELETYSYFYNWKESLILNPETFTTIRAYITSNKKNIKWMFEFYGVHLVDIGGIDLTSGEDAFNPVTFDVTLEYEHFTFERLGMQSETFESK